MVREDNIKAIFHITSRMHDDISDIYEELADRNIIGATQKINELIAELKILKSNLITKEKDVEE